MTEPKKKKHKKDNFIITKEENKILNDINQIDLPVFEPDSNIVNDEKANELRILFNTINNWKSNTSQKNGVRISRNNIIIEDKVTWYSKKSDKWLIGKVIKISNGSCKVQLLDNNYEITNIKDCASNNTLNFTRHIYKI